MKLEHKSIEWALNSLTHQGDTDLFPHPVELEALAGDSARTIRVLSDLDISQHQPGGSRRFIVPKDDLSFRPTTQLDPLDSLLFTAIVHQYGASIESRRRPPTEASVFSYRFNPASNGELYSTHGSWNKFWNCCLNVARSHAAVAIVDISDFYNQIYHHTIENQLVDSGLPNQAVQWTKRLLESVTAKVSRGVPVGPHPSHLLAEASLIPVDNSLHTEGVRFCRFVDDIVVFCKTEREVRPLLLRLAEVLDKQQRLQLNRGKTRIMSPNEFAVHANRMIEDQPLNDLEKELVSIIQKYSKGNPYVTVYLSQLTEDELSAFQPDTIETVLSGYLAQAQPDYIRLRWFLRRLTQVGHGGAVEFCVANLPAMAPAVSEVCQYFVAVRRANRKKKWNRVGKRLLSLLDHEIVRANEYFQLSILSLFSMQPDFNHLPRLVNMYKAAPPFMRREIVIAAAEADAADWLRELKEEAPLMDPWTKRAFLHAARTLPPDERRFFLRFAKKDSVLEMLIARRAR